jgi:hypothetical protein
MRKLLEIIQDSTKVIHYKINNSGFHITNGKWGRRGKGRREKRNILKNELIMDLWIYSS